MRKLSLLTVAIAACFLTVASAASAADRYASVAGTGDISSCIQSAPCSIADALGGTYSPGITIHLLPGTYTLPAGLTINQAVTVDGGTAADTTLHVTGVINDAIYLAANATLSDVTIEADQAGAGIDTQFGSTPILSRSIVKSAGGDACSGYSITIVDSICWSTFPIGNGFWNNTSGVSPQLTLRNATMIGGSGGCGLYVGMGSSTYNVNVTNTIFEGGAKSLAIAASGPEATPGVLNFTISHSNFVDFQAQETGFGEINDSIAAPSNQNSEPLLAADFTELAGSPTIDAGTTVGLTSATDLAGLVRNQGTAPDIGAYEFPVAPVIPPVDGGSGGGKTTPPDTTKPTITVSKKPKSKTTSKKLKVVFKADETATFLCKLNKGKFKACKSPYKKTVKLGKHKLQIKATDAAGNVSSVKTIKWTVKGK